MKRPAFAGCAAAVLATVLASAVPAVATSRRAARVAARGTAAVDHRAFNALLRKHVNDRGLVDYKGFKADEKALNQYLDQLSRNKPGSTWSQPEQLAFWINAYNAFTIRLILDYYPVESIRDIGAKSKATPWGMRFFSIGGERMSLDDIEHGILRKKFDDPRIHFALVCASLSCPRLRNEAYTAARLEAQLDEQGRDFLGNPTKNKISRGSAQLSKYFDWYKADWTKNGQSVAKWVNRYSTTRMDEQTPIGYLDYNWKLNQQ